MNEHVEVERWRMKTPGKVGIFSEHTVQGFQFDSVTGDRAWWVTAWSSFRPVTVCWVSNGKFYKVLLRFNGRQDSHIETFGEIEDIPQEKKRAILEAISKWEKDAEASN